MCRRIVVTLVLAFCLSSVFGQSSLLNGTFLKAGLIKGYSFAPNNVWTTKESLDGFVQGLDVGIGKLAVGDKEWQKTFGFPRVGIEAQFIQMNKPDTFGFVLGAMPYFELRLLNLKKSELNLRLGYGISYVSRRYDSLSNFDNRAVSMPLNFSVNAGLYYHHALTAQSDLSIGASYFHVSNGSFKMPNGGYNMILLQGSVSYFISQNPHKVKQKNDFRIRNGTDFYLQSQLAYGHRQQGDINKIRSFSVSSFSNTLYLRVNKMYSAGIGMDLFYDGTQPLIGDMKLDYSQIKDSQKIYGALGFSNQFEIGKLFVPVGVYRYIFDARYVKELTYIRFGLGVNVYKNLLIGCFFKGGINSSYKLESDFMEWTIGYRFFRNGAN